MGGSGLVAGVVCALVATLRLAAAADNTTVLVDDFDGPTALQSWRFAHSESASSGALALGAGHRGRGAVLQYRLPCDQAAGCGGSVAAIWTPSGEVAPPRNPAISCWIRFSPEVEAFLTVKDTSGQTLRLRIAAATLEHPKAGDWQYAAMSLSGSEGTGKIKGRIAEIGVMAQARGRAGVEGQVSFDDVRLLDSAEIFQAGATAAVEAPPPESAEFGSRLGVNIHVLQDDQALDLARDAGFRFVRMDLLWADVERNGRFRFGGYDGLLRALDSRGMGALWILDYGHPNHGGSTPRTAEDVAAFARFAGAAANHFKGRNVRYEIWNEPNTETFWKPFPNPAEYAALLGEAAAAIRRADPSAKVSSGGVGKIDLAFLSRAVGSATAANLSAIGIHPYRTSAPEAVAPEMGIAREWIRRAFGEGMEIWDTEWGYSSAAGTEDGPTNGHAQSGRKRQAVLAIRELLTVWAEGLPLAVWYDLRDDGPEASDAERNYGLIDSKGNEKPAMQAIHSLMDAVKGRTYAGMASEPPAGIHAMRLDGPADSILIVWTDQARARRKIAVAKQGFAAVTDLEGKAVKWKDGPSGAQVEIDEAAGPIYVRWQR
jgi:hypothetical protein